MKHISVYTQWKYFFAVLLITSINSFAQITYVTGVDTAFKHVNDPNIIYYNSDTVKLKGYLYKPQGKGPFPVYIWNHGEEKNPDPSASLISFWVKHGFIFFMPIRSGQDNNPGAYIRDEEKQIRRRKEMEMVQWKQVYALHQKANDDIIAALKWIKQRPNVDTNNIVISGEGYGGIQVLLMAQKDAQAPLGIKSFIAFFTITDNWNIMSIWPDSLTKAINLAKRPLFLLQVYKKSHILEDGGFILNPDKKQFPNRNKIFAAKNTEEFFADYKIWGKDVLKYLKDCGVKRKK